MFTIGDHSTGTNPRLYSCEKCGQLHNGIHACPAQPTVSIVWSKQPTPDPEPIRIPTFGELDRLFKEMEKLKARVDELERKAKEDEG